MGLDFVAVVILQVRMEFDYSKYSESRGIVMFFKKLICLHKCGSDSNSNENNVVDNDVSINVGYGISPLRVVVGLGAAVALVIVYQLIRGFGHNFNYNLLFVDMTVGVVIPFIFIYKHEGMWKTCQKTIKNNPVIAIFP